VRVTVYLDAAILSDEAPADYTWDTRTSEWGSITAGADLARSDAIRRSTPRKDHPLRSTNEKSAAVAPCGPHTVIWSAIFGSPSAAAMVPERRVLAGTLPPQQSSLKPTRTRHHTERACDPR